MKISTLKNYIENSKRILGSYNNPLKKKENVSLKDQLEKEFYDKEAEKYLRNFEEQLFLYVEDEPMPLSHQYFYSLLENIKNKKILDVCCGHGFTSVKCAKRGALVTGIDISPGMIELSRRNAEFNKVTKNTKFEIMSAQKMNFNDAEFDFVVGLGALHHLNLELAGKEISRVLKPGGKAVFIEPRIPFKWLIIIRSIFPNKCFESSGGSQLTDKEMKIFSGNFSSSHLEYFIFLKKLSRFPIFNRIDDKLEKIDSILVKKNKFLKYFYWSFVPEFVK